MYPREYSMTRPIHNLRFTQLKKAWQHICIWNRLVLLRFKAEVSTATVFKQNFKINEAKALEINGDQVGFQTVYSGQCCYHGILKRGKSWDRFHPHEKTTIAASRLTPGQMSLR